MFAYTKADKQVHTHTLNMNSFVVRGLFGDAYVDVHYIKDTIIFFSNSNLCKNFYIKNLELKKYYEIFKYCYFCINFDGYLWFL